MLVLFSRLSAASFDQDVSSVFFLQVFISNFRLMRIHSVLLRPAFRTWDHVVSTSRITQPHPLVTISLFAPDFNFYILFTKLFFLSFSFTDFSDFLQNQSCFNQSYNVILAMTLNSSNFILFLIIIFKVHKSQASQIMFFIENIQLQKIKPKPWTQNLHYNQLCHNFLNVFLITFNPGLPFTEFTLFVSFKQDWPLFPSYAFTFH